MADKTTTGGGVNQDIPWKWVDQADGTWAPRVSATVGTSATSNVSVVTTQTITWGVSAAAGTAGSATVTIPACDGTTSGRYDRPLLVLVRNVSAGTVSLDCRVQINWNDGSSRFGLLTAVAIPAGTAAAGDDGGTAFTVDKANLALGGRLAFVNTAIGPVGGISITVQVWQ